MTTKNTGLKGNNIIAFGRGKVILCDGKDTEYVNDGFVTWVIIDHAWTVRSWGTTHGLGELASNGPTTSTILDAIPHGIAIPVAAIHGMWVCTQAAVEAFKKPCAASDKEILKK
jgi:hypothetical protein